MASEFHFETNFIRAVCCDVSLFVRPSRTLQHHALLQCLSQCTEVTPYLLVMEFCPLVSSNMYERSLKWMNL